MPLDMQFVAYLVAVDYTNRQLTPDEAIAYHKERALKGGLFASEHATAAQTIWESMYGNAKTELPLPEPYGSGITNDTASTAERDKAA